MQVKGQSACQLKWKVVTLLVSLCVFIEETKGNRAHHLRCIHGLPSTFHSRDLCLRSEILFRMERKTGNTLITHLQHTYTANNTPTQTITQYFVHFVTGLNLMHYFTRVTPWPPDLTCREKSTPVYQAFLLRLMFMFTVSNCCYCCPKRAMNLAAAVHREDSSSRAADTSWGGWCNGLRHFTQSLS